MQRHSVPYEYDIPAQVVGFGNSAYTPSDVLTFSRMPFVRSDECKKNVTDQLAIFSFIPDKYCVGVTNSKYRLAGS